MKSYQDWKNKKEFLEFVGPLGQVDPQGLTPTPASPMSAPQAEPEGVSPDLRTMAQQVRVPQVATFLNLLQSKPAPVLMQVQSLLNQQINQMIQEKSKSMGRRNVWQSFNTARNNKLNYGRNG